MSKYHVPYLKAMNFTDVTIFALPNNHIGILLASHGWKLRQRSNWLKVTLFIIGKKKVNPSVLSLPKKCGLCIVPFAAHCLPRPSLHTVNPMSPNLSEFALIMARTQTPLLLPLVHPDTSVLH